MLSKYESKYKVNKLKSNYIEIDGVIYTNQDAINKAIEIGYKELVVSEKPTYDEETETLVAYYEESGNNIVQYWEIREIEPEE